MYGMFSHVHDEDPARHFTVVIPAYNAARWISDAITSAATQDPAPFEIIVVDDGSTDGTGDLAARHSGVRLITRPNGGDAAARNTGLEAARTRWVSLLDADDRFLPYRHRRIADHLLAHPDHVVVAADALILEDGVMQGRFRDLSTIAFPVDGQRATFLERDPILTHVVCDRERLLALGGFDEGLDHASDWDMWLRIVLDGGTIGFVDTPLSVYNRHDSSMTADPVRVVQGDIGVWEKARTLPQLTPAERAHVEEMLAAARATLARESMKQSIRQGLPDVRARAQAVARSPEQPTLARLKALAVLGAPGLHRGLLGRRSRFR